MSRDIGIATTQIRDRLDAIRRDLPSDFQRYQVLQFSPGNQPMLQIRFASPRDLSGARPLDAGDCRIAKRRPAEKFSRIY